MSDTAHSTSDLPGWGEADLPAPLPFSFANLIRTIGPGAILLAGSIGGGEWLVGPAMAVQYGIGVFWIATIAILLQMLFNLEAIRYTLYTGEPILTGIMRLQPGSKVWGPFYVLLTAAQLGVPALAAGCASVLFAAWFGRMPGSADGGALLFWTYGVIGLGVLLLLFGGTIERMLEWASWFMITFIFLFLLFINIWFVPPSHWLRTAAGFLQFGHIPQGVDLVLLATLAATAGAGGIGNLTLTNWVRDKGLGMGKTVGAISSAVGSKHVQLSHTGNVFPLTIDNLQRWREWWRYVWFDQVWLWGGGCFVGMFLNVNLATSVVPQGTDLSAVGAGAFQAKYLSDHLWSGLWALTLLNGFWILFSTHLNNTDVLVRTITDTLWVASPRVRRWRAGNVTLVYYSLLALFTVWGCIAVLWGDAMSLFKVLGVLANVVLAIASVQVLRVNTRLLPPPLRPPLWRRIALAACAGFYACMCVMVAMNWFRSSP